MGIFDWFKRARNPTQNIWNDQNRHPMIPRYTTPPDRNVIEWIQHFGKNPRLAVVERIASDLSFAEGKLFRIDKNGEEVEVKNHPFLDFWYNPNPLYEMSCAAVWRLLEIYLKLKGEGYFIIQKDKRGTPCELWPLPVHWVQMTPYENYPFYTVRTTPGTLLQIPVEDMFVMKDLDPLDPYKRGHGQAEALEDEIETDEYAAKFQKKFFYNDATPGIILSTPGSTEENRKRFIDSWKENFQGVQKSHGVAMIDGNITVTKLSENMKDMDMIQGRTYIRDACMEHFGIPREIMGITESSNRATSEAAQFIYAQNVLMPNLIRREEAINKQLIPLFGDDIVWRFDDIIPKNQEFDKVKAIDGWNSGLLTQNEARELLGIEPSEKGDIYKSQISDIFIRQNEDPAAVSESMSELQFADPTDEYADFYDSDEKQKKKSNSTPNEIQRIMQNAKHEEELKFFKALDDFFDKQDKRISQKLFDALPQFFLENGGFLALDSDERERIAADFILAILDWKLEEKAMIRVLDPLWKSAFDKGAEKLKVSLRIEGIKNPVFSDHAKVDGGKRVKYITQTTRRNIAKIVADGIEDADNNKVVADRIRKTMGTTEARARTIAAQESNTSLITGEFYMAKSAGFKTKTWHISGASNTNVRDTHRKLNNVTVPIDAKFKTAKGVLLSRPLDPLCTDASEVVNCHCYMTYGFD